jgi:SAM-dependent methyltransferase
VRFGSLRRLTPFSRTFGGDRGQPVDRYYIDHFLRRHTDESGYAPSTIRGRVLEVGEAQYTRGFGDPSAIDSIEILDVSATNPTASLIGDLVSGDGIPPEDFDCIICTQTLLFIYELKSAVQTLHRALKPGGTLLLTVPGISQICRPDMDVWGDYWRFTTASARRLFEEVFAAEDVSVESYGNVLSAAAFLYGLSAEDLRRFELDVRDPDYQLIIAVKAVKGLGSSAG